MNRLRIRKPSCRNALAALLHEQLESRKMLTASYPEIELSPSSAWFAIQPARTQYPSELAKDSNQVSADAGTRLSPAASDWIIQLRPEAYAEPSFEQIDQLLNTSGVYFETVRGLGKPGLIQVRAYSQHTSVATESLAMNSYVASYWENVLFSGAAIPNDSDFGSLIGLHNVGQFNAAPDADIDAVEAWNETTGSSSTVVAVIDSGIDVSHPDLYLNIWINQGELPKGLGQKLRDVDDDQLITLYDLNDSSNASLVRDYNVNR